MQCITLKFESSLKFNITSCNTLSSGIEQLNKKKIDVILLDLGLPDGQGFETISQMIEITPHIPIIVLTGKNDQDCHNDPNIMIMRKWIVMFAFRRKIGSFLLIYGYAPVPILHRSIKITFNPNEHCPGRCILCTLVFDIIQNFCRIPIFGLSSKTKDSTVF